MKNQLLFLSLLFIGITTTTACVQIEEAFGEDDYVKQTLNLDRFDQIGLSLDATVYVRQGSRQSVEIEASERALERLNKEVRNGRWNIGFEGRNNMRNYGSIDIWITVPKLEKVSIAGSGKVLSENTFTNSDEFTANISGSGDLKMAVEADEVKCMVTGSGTMELRGEANEQKLTITGSGDIESYGLQTKHCVARITGSGESEVSVSDQLEVYITGSGDVSYKGDPRLKSRVTGSGDVRNRN